MGHFKSLEAYPEDVFRETARLLDFLLSQKDISQRNVDGLWTLLVNDIRLWKPDAHDDDKMLMAGTVFLLVKKILCHHVDGYYRDTIHDMLEDTLERELNILNEQEHQLFLNHLSECSELLSDWINEYNDSEVWLSDEIEEALAAKQPKKKEKAKEKPNKEAVIKTSFKYNPINLDKGTRNIRLQKVFEDMRKEEVELIPVSTNMKDFLEIFSGEDTLIRIAWSGNTNELHYIFSEWIRRKYLPRPNGGLWLVVSARFYHRKKDAEGVWVDENFTPDELRKAGNPKNPSDDLEQIIEMLKPDERVRRYGG